MGNLNETMYVFQGPRNGYVPKIAAIWNGKRGRQLSVLSLLAVIWGRNLFQNWGPGFYGVEVPGSFENVSQQEYSLYSNGVSFCTHILKYASP